MPDCGSVRKLRFGAKGKEKSCGARVNYYLYNDEAPIYALLAYPKNAKTDLTTDDRSAVAAVAKAIKAAARSLK